MNITIKQLRERAPWGLAKKLRIGYFGDCNPVEHGGFFYSLKDWAQYGYAETVEFYTYENRYYVSLGTINRPSDLSAALRCIGFELNANGKLSGNGETDLPLTLEIEIEASKAYYGIETADSFSFAPDKNGWAPEFKIMKFARPHILNLS